MPPSQSRAGVRARVQAQSSHTVIHDPLESVQRGLARLRVHGLRAGMSKCGSYVVIRILPRRRGYMARRDLFGFPLQSLGLLTLKPACHLSQEFLAGAVDTVTM